MQKSIGNSNHGSAECVPAQTRISLFPITNDAPDATGRIDCLLLYCQRITPPHLI